MSKHRFLPLGLTAAALVWLAGSGLKGQDRPATDRDRSTANAVSTYTGRIVLTDEAKRTIVLSLTKDAGRTGARDDRPAADRIAKVPSGDGGIPATGTITGQPRPQIAGTPQTRGTGAPGTEEDRRRPGADGPRPGTTADSGAPGTESDRRRPGADGPGAIDGRSRTTDGPGSPMRTFRVWNSARITNNGKVVTFTDLRMGQTVRVHIHPDADTRNASAGQILPVDRIEVLPPAPVGPRSGTGRPGDGDRTRSTGRPSPGDDRPGSASRPGGGL